MYNIDEVDQKIKYGVHQDHATGKYFQAVSYEYEPGKEVTCWNGDLGRPDKEFTPDEVRIGREHAKAVLIGQLEQWNRLMKPE